MGTWNAPIETHFDGSMASSKPRWDVDGKTFRSRRSCFRTHCFRPERTTLAVPRLRGAPSQTVARRCRCTSAPQSRVGQLAQRMVVMRAPGASLATGNCQFSCQVHNPIVRGARCARCGVPNVRDAGCLAARARRPFDRTAAGSHRRRGIAWRRPLLVRDSGPVSPSRVRGQDAQAGFILSHRPPPPPRPLPAIHRARGADLRLCAVLCPAADLHDLRARGG